MISISNQYFVKKKKKRKETDIDKLDDVDTKREPVDSIDPSYTKDSINLNLSNTPV